MSCEIPKLLPEGSPKFVPGLLVMILPSLSPTDPSMCLQSDLGLPEVKEDRAKEKSLRLKQIQGYIFGEVGGIVSIHAK